MSGVGITYLWTNKKFPSFIRLEGRRGDYEVYTPERTCEIVATSTNNLMYPDYMVKWYELSCGHSLTLKGEDEPKWCAVCGKKVK